MAPGSGEVRRLRIVVNGTEQEFSAPLTVADLVQRLGLGDARVAVERNKQIVPRARHAVEALADGDRIELVTFLGGG